MKRFTIVLVSGVLLTGCKHDDAGGPQLVRLDKLGLQIEVPGNVKVGDGLGGDGVAITGKQAGEIRIEVEKTAPTLEQVKHPEGVVPRNVASETLGDGFVVTYDFAGTLDPTYAAEVHRTIAGHKVACTSRTGGQDWQAATVAACKSLRP